MRVLLCPSEMSSIQSFAIWQVRPECTCFTQFINYALDVTCVDLGWRDIPQCISPLPAQSSSNGGKCVLQSTDVRAWTTAGHGSTATYCDSQRLSGTRDLRAAVTGWEAGQVTSPSQDTHVLTDSHGEALKPSEDVPDCIRKLEKTQRQRENMHIPPSCEKVFSVSSEILLMSSQGPYTKHSDVRRSSISSCFSTLAHLDIITI